MTAPMKEADDAPPPLRPDALSRTMMERDAESTKKIVRPRETRGGSVHAPRAPDEGTQPVEAPAVLVDTSDEMIVDDTPAAAAAPAEEPAAAATESEITVVLDAPTPASADAPPPSFVPSTAEELAAAYSLKELKDMARKKDLSIHGKKIELAQRLMASD